MGESDSWVARWLDGDHEAFAEIYDAYASAIYDFCRSILRSDADAADATQDTFVAAHQKLGSLRDASKLRPWLYAIARHQSLRMVELHRRTEPDADLEQMNDEAIDLDAGMTELDSANLIWDAAAALAPKDRLVLDLHLRHGLAGQDLADALEVTRQNAYVLIDKMKRALARAAGALLVARYNRQDCPELDALLGGWDGHYEPLIRKRIARHVDDCEVCERNKAALVAPERLFSLVPIAGAPVVLRARVLSAVHAQPRADGASSDGGQPDPSSRRLSLGSPVLLAIAGFVLLAGLAAIVLTSRQTNPAPRTSSSTSLAPAGLTTTDPAISTTATGVPSSVGSNPESSASTTVPATTTAVAFSSTSPTSTDADAASTEVTIAAVTTVTTGAPTGSTTTPGTSTSTSVASTTTTTPPPTTTTTTAPPPTTTTAPPESTTSTTASSTTTSTPSSTTSTSPSSTTTSIVAGPGGVGPGGGG